MILCSKCGLFVHSFVIFFFSYLCSIFGHKVNTCVPGTKPINGMYPACKFALTALTECFRQEISYIEMGIKVTVRSLFAILCSVLLKI